ncbi:hypothetical protein TNCV_5461 [Trichonephila clavipes]|nr:hypothetical protein TNCV_5461 [Trichonephila clavipes]
MEKGLIAASAECSVCKKAMNMIKRNSSDGYIWEEFKGANAHRIKTSLPLVISAFLFFSRIAALRLRYLNILESSKFEVTVAGSIAFLIMPASL